MTGQTVQTRQSCCPKDGQGFAHRHWHRLARIPEPARFKARPKVCFKVGTNFSPTCFSTVHP